ncbi:MAG: hypothetical protein WCA89_09515 [Terracidiphilus sp.]
MLTLYADESGQHQDEERMFVAGYMGNDDAWKKLPGLWKQAIYPRPHLHLNRVKFKRDSEKQMLEKAGIVPKVCGLTPILGGVRTKDYRYLVRRTLEEQALCGYAICVYAMVYSALRVVPTDERLEVVLEQQDRYGVYAQAAMQVIADMGDNPEILMADGRPKLANWRFVPKHSTSLTEPGDYLAYALFQLWKDQTSRRSIWCRPILDAHGGKGVGHIWTRAEASEIVLAGPLFGFLSDGHGLRALTGIAKSDMSENEFTEFNKAVEAILRADPKAFREAIEKGKQANEERRKAEKRQTPPI